MWGRVQALWEGVRVVACRGVPAFTCLALLDILPVGGEGVQACCFSCWVASC